jgi:hypothetical protein
MACYFWCDTTVRWGVFTEIGIYARGIGGYIVFMMNRTSRNLLLLAFAMVVSAIAAKDVDDSPPSGKSGVWQIIKQDQGITVERRFVEGSPLVEFKSHGVIDASVMEILAVISDTKNHPKWVANSIETRILQRTGDSGYIYYSAIKAPWPVADRDFVSKARVIVNEKEKSVTIKTYEVNHPAAPTNTGRVRMPFIRVTWHLQTIKGTQGKKTYLTFQVHANPGGLLPNWVINLASKGVPLKSIINLRRRLAETQPSPEFLEKYKKYKDWH